METRNMLAIAQVIGRLETLSVQISDSTFRNYLLNTIKVLKDLIYEDEQS